MDNICHYTKAETANKILSNKILWASDYRFFDDASEIQFLFNQITEIMPIGLNKNIDLLKEAIQSMTKETGFYISSFSRHEKNSQDER